MVEVKTGNVFDTDAKYICHQVNCKGKMASGVAKEVRERYPNVYWEYMNIWERSVGLGKQDNSKVAMPYKIGCVRGGADWSVVEPMIEEIFKDVHCELWKLD